FIEEKVIRSIKNMLSAVKENEGFVDRAENGIKNAIGNLIEQNHDKSGTLIKENLDKLDNEQLIDLMENKIGKELSWIRVNGSLCGFLIGIILTVTQLLLSSKSIGNYPMLFLSVYVVF